MSAVIAAMSLFAALDPSLPAELRDGRWLGCGALQTPLGTVIVDNLAYVFFDTDSATITPQGAAVLDGFVSGYLAPGECRVAVVGHADRVGPATYNLRLSRRRARAVVAYLRRRGFAAPIVIAWHGETRPLLETADGVGEAQNRYVVVVGIESPPPR